MILKPCPFCGSEPKLAGSGKSFWVVCADEDCRVEVRSFVAEQDEAIRTWNERAP